MKENFFELNCFIFILCQGSVSNQCNPSTGVCKCLIGFEGANCDKCADGYYNFPKCRPCNCDPAGTRPDQCNRDGLCKCDRDGRCLCKASSN